MSSGYRLAPWTDVARPHEDVAAGVLDMGTYAANLAGVFRGRPGIAPVYTDAGKFYEATYLTAKMSELLNDVMEVLAGGQGSHVLQLRTPFGGGKTHSLVALLHLVRDRQAAISACSALKDIADPGDVQVAVLSGEELDPLSPMKATGIETSTLWGELGAQLGRYELVAEHDRAGSAPGGDTLRRVLGDGPTLVLLDEVLVFVEKAMAIPRGESTAGRQAMLFVQALTEAISSHPKAVMVYSLQASVGEAVGAEGLLSDLDKLVARVDAKREPVADDEVLRVVQRRLLAEIGDETVHGEVARAYAQLLRKQLLATAETSDGRREAEVAADNLEKRILAAYPFHPDLLDLMYHRWGSLPSYQRTRGALQFLAAVVHVLWRNGAKSPLIGPGDIDFTDEQVRGAFFSQVGERERFTAVLSSDITSSGSGAATVDRRLGADSPTISQLAVGTRVASAVMLYSFGAREGEDRGVLESDLVRGVLVPGLDRNVVLAALHDLREEELYLHYTGRRYRFEPTPNLTKLVRDEANKLTSQEVLADVRSELELQLRGSLGVSLWPDGPGGIADEQPLFTVCYLHPDWSEDREPLGKFVEQAGKAGARRYRNGVAFVLPDNAQFDRARHAIRLRLAADKLLTKAAKYGFSPEQIDELREKSGNARRDASAALGMAYSAVAVPARPRAGDNAPYSLETFDLRTMLAAGRALHERVVEALSQRVFSSVTASKLVALSGLGPDRKIVRCSELVDWFYSYYEFTKLWKKQAIATAVANAVASSELGYVVGLSEEQGSLRPRDSRQIRLGERVPADEIDLSDDSAILWHDYARELMQEVFPSPGEPAAEPTPKPQATAGAGAGPSSVSTTTQPTPPAPPAPADVVRNVDIRAKVDKSGIGDLYRSLAWLREQPGAVDVEIHISAEGPFDRIAFRNGLVEPIEESDPNAEVRAD
ncbi:DUF499 domain-containing protein [Streptomyces sp. SP17BM10]|uniref:ATP-binding protein n=1 Tax=Streptomyces sp. SP17BM10 TaxID=3002530 RepID=UPI002E7798AE|nr:DUF499 domain-containing protein [Streptomyces sp. SP17BM10]MEE1786890.1 DUF499 domain-containing protein [Streptomyces sp. SP17BM10]